MGAAAEPQSPDHHATAGPLSTQPAMSAPTFFGPLGTSAPPSPRPSPDRALYFSWFQLADQGKIHVEMYLWTLLKL